MSASAGLLDDPTLQGAPKDDREAGCARIAKVTFALVATALLIATLAVTVDTNTQARNANTSLKGLNDAQTAARTTAYGVPSMPPRKYQMARGTCWDFGTVGAIEHQYRLQGLSSGALQDGQYTQFSEQAYGNRIIGLCQQNQKLCLLPGDHVAFNSTNGGEAILLQTFAKQLSNLVLPESVCPYLNPADNSSCPGIDKALASNPISFTVDSAATIFDIPHIKQALMTSQHAMPLTIAVHTTSYYISCNDEFVKSEAVCTQPDLCIPCPSDSGSWGGASCCYEYPTEMFHMNGEFYKHHALQLEAGHVMLLAGFNDEWQTEDGMKGGLIVRNTWMDGVYSFDEFGTDKRQRGSLSLQYFLGQITLADERMICPNSPDPRMWYPCGNGGGPDDAVIADCTGKDVNGVNENAITATALYQPYELTCTATDGECVNGASYYYINSTKYNDGLVLSCFLYYPSATPHLATAKCFMPRPLDEYSLLFQPKDVAGNTWDGYDDFCGYYIIPYDLIRESNAAFPGTFFVSDYHLTFSDASYLSNADSTKDYTLVGSSTKTQLPFPAYDNAYPNGMTRPAQP